MRAPNGTLRAYPRTVCRRFPGVGPVCDLRPVGGILRGRCRRRTWSWYEWSTRGGLGGTLEQHADAVDAGSQVIVAGRARGTAKASRMELDQKFAFVWTVRKGLLTHVRVFTDRDEALKAAGLSE
jgi:hypothetical protein